jgi:formate dehydrogenase beta subunit
MGISRRSALKLIAATTSMSAAQAISPAPADAAPLPVPPDAIGMLYDATKCIGCKACVAACTDANSLEPDTAASDGLWQAPVDLNGNTKTLIKYYEEGSERSFVKQQCMHCIDPACAAACMLGALKKREWGAVTYNVDTCIGCRYCQMACPFGVPKFEWTKALTPKIVKCEFCMHRLVEGKEPACTETCPREAVIFGKRADLLREAHRRIAENPDFYINKVYGETEAGGTQVLYLSHVPFEKLGLPTFVDDTSVPHTARRIQHGVYKGFIAPVALYGVLAAVMVRNRKKDATSSEEEQR